MRKLLKSARVIGVTTQALPVLRRIGAWMTPTTGGCALDFHIKRDTTSGDQIVDILHLRVRWPECGRVPVRLSQSAVVIRKDSSRSAGLQKRIMRPTLGLEDTAMVVYAFDVDETLEVSKGPVKLSDLVTLREHGHIVGLCGN